MKTIDVENLVLEKGSHDTPKQGMCVMELASWLAREPFSDHPQCVSPILGAFLRSWNDTLDTETRQRLKPYAQRVVNTNTGRQGENIRFWMLIDWLIRTYTPAWLELANLGDHAEELRSFPQIVTPDDINRVRPIINDSCKAASAAWDAAWDAARDAAWDAAWDAARAAAGAAARDAAGAAARQALDPTTTALQASAFDLIDRLIAVSSRNEVVQCQQ